ncbi:ABC-type amino acid transport/signal transduction systems, periplasmic component/domain [Pseudoalteromonas luteoviolacea B = ATCC 29581]|nr:ABC-type amino acid transport/signal transduction systems, periplasmic component/domain [Pseudoalteromonas luteoviolacea B = ATCC 29581]
MRKFFAVCLFIGFSHTVQAFTLRFVAEELPPYHYYDEQGQAQGVLVDVVKNVIGRTPYKANFELMPMARAFYELAHSPNTLMFSLLKTQQREAELQFLGSTYYATAFLFGLKSTTKTLTHLDDARRMRVSTIRGYHSATYLQARGFSEEDNLVLVSEYHSLWQMLYLGRTDLVMTNALTIEKEIKDSGLNADLVEAKLALYDFPSQLHIAAAKTFDPQIAKNLTQALIATKNSGDYAKILDKWNVAQPIKNTLFD